MSSTTKTNYRDGFTPPDDDSLGFDDNTQEPKPNFRRIFASPTPFDETNDSKIFSTSPNQDHITVVKDYYKRIPKPSERPLFQYQKDAATRFTARGRFQRGAILYHSMGSGKTLTSLYILKNFSPEKRWLVILPKGLDSEWIDGMCDLMGGSQDLDSVEKLRKNVDFLDYKKIKEDQFNSNFLDTYRPLFENHYIVCDEAHKLLDLFRSQITQSEDDESVGLIRPLDQLFALATRVFLVTGTPIQKNIGDIGVLINIVAKEMIAPPTTDMFLQKYGEKNAYFSIPFAFSVGAGLSNIFKPFINAANYALSASIIGGQVAKSSQQFMKSAGAAYLAIGPIAKIAGGAAFESFQNWWTNGNLNYPTFDFTNTTLFPFDPPPTINEQADPSFTSSMQEFLKTNAYIFSMATSMFGVIAYLNKKYGKISFDTARMMRDIGPYISYYDFETAVKHDPSKRNQMPVKNIIKRPIPMDDFQMLQFANLAFDAGTSTIKELRIVTRIGEGDLTGAGYQNIEQIEQFVRYGRVVGNLSLENLCYTTVRIKSIKTHDNEGYREPTIFERNYRAIPRTDTGKPEVLAIVDYAFGCPKFMKALDDLYMLRRSHEYIPVVYSCFDKYGFQLFSAFLTSANVPHLVVHADDDLKHRSNVMTAAKKKYDVWTDDYWDGNGRVNAKTLENRRNNPLCVLIHPKLTEGLSFNLNPAILVLEVPYGYGVREQIYARVLRKIVPTDPEVNELLDKDGLLQKKIYQYESDNSFAKWALSEYEFAKDNGAADLQFTSPIGLKLNPIKTKKIAVEIENVRYVMVNPDEPTDSYTSLKGAPLPVDGAQWKEVGFYPQLSSIFQCVRFSVVMQGLILSTKESVSTDDPLNLYLTKFKHGIYVTPDQLAQETNIKQESQMTTIRKSLSEQNDNKVAIADSKPYRFDDPTPDNKKVKTSQIAPDDIADCIPFNPKDPDNPNACSKKPMSKAEYDKTRNKM